MDFEKSPLMNDISRCRREVKRWLALVALTLAALLTGMVSAVTAPSPEAQEIANFLMIASVTAIICSLFGVKQSNDHCRSVQYGLSVFEAMKKDLEGTEIELTSARYDVTDAQSDLYFAKKNAETLQDELTSVRAELEETRDWLEETEDELASVKFELSKAKLKLRRKEGEAQLAERCYEDLRKACSETTLDLLRTKRERDDLQSERDDLQSKLATARRFARRLLAERNELIAERDELRYQLVEARIGFEFFQGEYIKAGALIADAKEQIKGLESAVEVRDKVIGSLLDDVVIRTKG